MNSIIIAYLFASFRYIGGCCGFEAYHIRAISEVFIKFQNVMAVKCIAIFLTDTPYVCILIPINSNFRSLVNIETTK